MGVAELAGAVLQTLPDNQYPHLTEMATAHVTGPGHDYSNDFEFGQDLILDGLETHRDA